MSFLSIFFSPEYVLTDSDTDSIDDEVDNTQCQLLYDEQTKTENQFEEDNYLPDHDDNMKIDDDDDAFGFDDTPPLYYQATMTTGKNVKRLMAFFIKSNFDKFKIVKIMRLIKLILPTPNKLPTTFRQILKIFGKVPSSMPTFLH